MTQRQKSSDTSDTPAGYDELPESLQQVFTPGEYAWMSDRRKAQLIQDETEPEPEP